MAESRVQLPARGFDAVKMTMQQFHRNSPRWRIYARDERVIGRTASARLGSSDATWGTAAQSATPMSSIRYLNLVGPQIRKLRYQRGWSQNDLAVRLQLAGLDKDRTGVGKIEARLVHVSDFELLYISEVLDVELVDLYPKQSLSKLAKEIVPGLMERRIPTITQLGEISRNGNNGSNSRL